jgi:hypothetical protein
LHLVHRSKIEQSVEYLCKTTTYIRFTRLHLSCPQSCAQKVGTTQPKARVGVSGSAPAAKNK